MSILSELISVLASCPARDGIGLGVAIEDLDPVGLVADLEARGQRLAGELENIAVSLAEAAERAGARADEADLERRLGARRESAVRARRRRDARSSGR